MENSGKIDVIVVGAGPAGIAAAITVARGGASVVVIERAENFGSKNMFGGAVYLDSLKKLFPVSWEEAPLESYISQYKYSFLTDSSSVDINYKTLQYPNSATVFRPKFDSWLVEEAKREGVYFAPKTTVRELLLEKKKVVGVKTDNEEIRANIVILADGVQSQLAQSIKLKKPLKPENLILGVKETFYLDEEKIKQRFGLIGNQGLLCEYFGGLFEDENQKYPFAMGFLYTFKNHITLGVGINLEDLKRLGLKPYEVLEKLKSHPTIIPILEDAKSIEYSAHTIPDGGLADISKLYSHGVMVVGDAAGLVNNVHFEGTNFAIHSGILAGETAISALQKRNYTKSTLSLYEKKFKKSFMYQDLKSYKNVVKNLREMSDSIFRVYPKKLDEFLTIFNTTDTLPKAKRFRKFFNSAVKIALKDGPKLAKTVLEVLK
ncbi:FAD-dependent oxidoreductase [bacterium]|nr:FAD-dependent oxidoreductase [bacterium]